jgi:TPP-dependent indolepyruvate ferredoxin oxidoreductase alpha subunit
MATINASISINSDISSYPITISKTMTMKKAGSCHGLEETLGLKTKKFTTTTAAEIATLGDLTNDGAHKLYIRNASTNKANFFYVAYNASAAAATTAETIGKLYGGDWMLMPYNGSTDINVASSTTDTQYLEYMVFADGVVEAIG